MHGRPHIRMLACIAKFLREERYEGWHHTGFTAALVLGTWGAPSAEQPESNTAGFESRRVQSDLWIANSEKQADAWHGGKRIHCTASQLLRVYRADCE